MEEQWIPFLFYFVLRLTFENIIVIKPHDSQMLNKLTCRGSDYLSALHSGSDLRSRRAQSA